VKALLITILFVASFLSHGNETFRSDYELLLKRVSRVDLYLPEYTRIKTSLETTQNDLSSFEHVNILKPEEQEISIMQSEASGLVRDLGSPSSQLFTSQIHKDLDAVQLKIQERESFLENEKLKLQIEKQAAFGAGEFSKRFERFIHLQKNGKDIQADLLLRVLPKHERDFAQQYVDSRNYILRESGMQDYLLTSIPRDFEMINSKLKHPEEAITKAEEADLKNIELRERFTEIQDHLKLFQYDLQFKESWQVGSFGCRETNPREYYTFDHFPGWILLKNEEGSAIVKVNQSQPSSFEILYRCEKSGSFGFCLDNKMKQYCRLDPECLSLQSNLEGQFNPVVEFKNNFLGLTTKYAKETYEDVFSKLLPVYDSVSHYWTHQDFRGFADKIEAERSAITATTPAEYKQKFKLILTKHEKEIDRYLKQKPGYEETSELARISKNLARHFILTLEGHTDTVAQNDKIEEFSASQCSLQVNIQSPFCQAHSLWSQRIKVFSEPRPLKNLAPQEECPRAVFRVNPSSGHWSQKSCGPDVPPVSRTISPLDRDVRTILRSIPKT
jgi:hypothetical protein